MEEVKEALGCLAWVIVIVVIIALCTVASPLLSALNRWAETL